MKLGEAVETWCWVIVAKVGRGLVSLVEFGE